MKVRFAIWMIVCLVVTLSPRFALSANIKIDGRFMEWRAIPSLATDSADGCEPCDWIDVRAVRSGDALAFCYTCAEAIDFSKGAAYNIFIDADADRSTGYRGGGDDFPVGADFVVQGATLYKYGGSGTDWYWHEPEALAFEIAKKAAEIAVPLSSIGNPPAVHFFLYADNEAEGVGGKGGDVCPDKALKPGGKGRKLKLSLR